MASTEAQAAESEDQFENTPTAASIAKAISSKEVNIDTLLKVPVSLAIEVGRTQVPLSELIEIEEGAVLELDRLLDEPIDILVNGALIAHGVVVLANEKFGLQITDIISLEERAKNL
jgi:flagellar motor switch protein FliN/FliY